MPIADKGSNQGCFFFLSGENTGYLFKHRNITLENKTAALGKASVVKYFQSIPSLFKDQPKREYLFQCASDFSSSSSQNVGLEDVFSMQSFFADLGPISLDSTQQEPPGVY